MNKPSPIILPEAFSRRSFLKTSTAVAGGALLGSLAPERFAHAASGTDELKIALVGCGGRGSGAANQALSTYTLGPVKLVAMGDVHEDRLTKSLENLQKQHADRVDVPKERQFLGFDAYKKAIELADVVILATPPGFRPMQFEAAVKAGKNVFMEKPVASDAAGVRQVLAAAEEAKKKGLKVGVGLQRHHQDGYIETIKRLHDGAIGDIVSMRAYWNGQRPWQKKRADLNKLYGKELTEMEYQLRNWYYFTWLSGDHIAEQHIHNLDVINWVKKAHPVKARAMGGREINNSGADDGEIYDHFAVQFEYEDGSICYSECRQQPGCWNSVSEHAQGTKGKSDINKYQIFGDNQWRYKAEGAKDPYQQEHDDLFTAIRQNKDYNEAVYGAESTMTSILGRMAAYSGKEVEYSKALASKIALLPESLAWDAKPKVLPGPDGLYPRAIPGKTDVLG
jgi:predicted dehydrogenase